VAVSVGNADRRHCDSGAFFISLLPRPSLVLLQTVLLPPRHRLRPTHAAIAAISGFDADDIQKPPVNHTGS
jgi:hypothetical protein